MRRIVLFILTFLVSTIGYSQVDSTKIKVFLAKADSVFKVHKVMGIIEIAEVRLAYGSSAMLPLSREYTTLVTYKSKAETDYAWIPASTFKIPNTLAGIRFGIIRDTNFTFKYDGKPRMRREWEKNLRIREAFRLSCVPCYQDLARKIGYTQMKHFVDSTAYGRMDVTPENIDRFWLEGKSRISLRRQLLYLMKQTIPLLPGPLPLIDQIMEDKLPDGKLVYHKTGTWETDEAKGGWYIGWMGKPSLMEGNAQVFGLHFRCNSLTETAMIAERKAIFHSLLKWWNSH